MKEELFCRDCHRAIARSDAIFLDECNCKTKLPICRDCYERLVRRAGYNSYNINTIEHFTGRNFDRRKQFIGGKRK